MDRWMPVLDGFEAARQMRQIPGLAGVVIITVSASMSAQDQAQSREAGIDAFLPKPVSWPRLAALLEEHLKLEWESLAPARTPTLHVSARDAGDQEQGGEALAPVPSLPLEPPPHIPTPLVPPPGEELAVLHDLARMGDMEAIQERATHIEALGEQYVPFAHRLRELAEGFEERQILALVVQYLEAQQ
jgi:response regulator RpfG family c-di-GMP phosphodiesterase